MKVAVAFETDPGEPRVAATPETVKKLIGLGVDVAVEPGAGIKSGILDADYAAAGATLTADAVNGAEIVLQVRRPQSAERACLNLIYPELTSSRQIPWNASRTTG